MHIIFRNGLTAARRNLGPGLLLQGFALAMVLLYYFNPTVHQQLLKIPEIRQRLGMFFPILGTALFGGVIPFLFLCLRGEVKRGRRIAELLFLIGFWAVNGLMVDLFYQIQAVLFGNQPDFMTVLKKVLMDQFVYSVFWVPPFVTLTLHWKNCGYSFSRAIQKFSLPEKTIQLFSIMMANWGIWLPTVSIIYCLPLALQFPLFNIVLCFWSLLLTALNQGEARDIDYQPTAVCPN
ncbi:MAG: DUF621 domain-containing protein [Kiritimatiellales bacterium]